MQPRMARGHRIPIVMDNDPLRVDAKLREVMPRRFPRLKSEFRRRRRADCVTDYQLRHVIDKRHQVRLARHVNQLGEIGHQHFERRDTFQAGDQVATTTYFCDDPPYLARLRRLDRPFGLSQGGTFFMIAFFVPNIPASNKEDLLLPT